MNQLNILRPRLGRKLFAVLSVLLFYVVQLAGSAAQPAFADGGDFTIENAAAAPETYTHATGGGAWNDGTIGNSEDIVKSLEGGDFACGDWVTFLSKITVAADAAGSQTIRITYDLTDHATGQQGVALIDVDHVMINYGDVENGGGLGAGTYGTDTGMSDDFGSTASISSETKDGLDYVKPTLLTVAIDVDDLEADEVVILRFDALIGCNGQTPTGNMQQEIKNAITVDGDTINAGNQTIPFKNVGNIERPPGPAITTLASSDGTETGDTIQDTATLTGGDNPTGTITFSLYGPDTIDCTEDPIHTEVVEVNGAGDYPTVTGFVIQTKGSYTWVASYSGDVDNFPAVTACNDPDETLAFDAATPTVVTTIHLDDESVVESPFEVALGSIVHDSAAVSGPDALGDPTGTVDFTFYTTLDCTGDGVAAGTVDLVDGVAHPSESQGPLAAGSYSFSAHYNSSDTDVWADADSACEPLTVNKADTTTTTQVHRANHVDITNGYLDVNTYVHDSATVSSPNTSFTIGGTATYSFFTNGDCSGEAFSTETVAVGAESTPQLIAVLGAYSYLATYSGDGNYNGSTGVCEPFSVVQLGYTMGFWGNRNGIALIMANGGYADNAVYIGRGAIIDTQAESLKVLPTQLNACGKGTPFIFAVGAQTATKDCTLATGINKNSLNTLAAQTLALGYNIKLVTGPAYSGQTIGSLGCTAYLTADLTADSTVDEAFAAAVALIDESASGGSTTQAQIGAMNLLLRCLNREA